MIYFSIFIIILILTIYEFYTDKFLKKSFNVIYSIITIMAALRYGVGSDYFNYMYHFSVIPKLNDPKFIDFEIHGEFGYKVLQGLFKMFNLDYFVFVFVITLLTMLLFYHFILNYSESRFLSLLVFYSMYYFTYINSGIRQGLSLALFVSILLPLLQKKMYFKYVVLTLFFSLIHSSIIIVLVLPLIFFSFNKINFSILFIIASGISLIDFAIFLKPIDLLYNIYLGYTDSSVNILAIMSRVIIFLIIIAMYLKNKDKVDFEYKKNIDYYILGILIYILLSRSPLIASRLHVYFKAFEIILIPNTLKLIEDFNKKKIITYMIALIMIIMWIKEVDAALIQGEYYSQNIFQYPYTTIFNKEDAYLFRPINPNYGDIY